MPILSGVPRRPPSRKIPDSPPLELVVEKLVPGGDGLARHQGKVIFIPGALPGETVRVRLKEAKKDFARAELEAVLTPSPARIQPPCPVAGRCGGCDWQHLEYAEQLRQKVALAQDALRRMGGIAWPELSIEAGEPWRYRSRARLHAAREDRPSPTGGPGGPTRGGLPSVPPPKGGRLGFLARGSHQVIPVTTCPVVDPALDALLAAGVGGAAGAGGPPSASDRRAGNYMAWGHAGQSALAPLADEPDRERGRGGDSAGFSDGGALEGSASGSAPGAAEASRELRADILGKSIRFDLRCFFQSNPSMLEKLIPYALEGLSGGRAMDLYCGVGLFGAFLADRFRTVLAVESNPASLAYARRNIPGPDHLFLEGKLEDLVLQGRLGGPDMIPEAVVVDPPRPGLDQAVRDWLAEARPPKLVYVSCNPVTLARDLKSLLASGYKLDDLKLFDFYPQTAHIEAVAKLSIQ